MRSGKELILATKEFVKEDRVKSWKETILTLILTVLTFLITLSDLFPWYLRILTSLITALLYVRFFVIYHDYQHHSILQHSKPAEWLMKLFGIFILAPQTIWKRSHDHHHNHNSKLTLHGIGSYPTISTERFFKLSESEKKIYLINRHPLTVIFGYFTLFIFWLNIKSFIQSPKNHWDSFIALVFHFASGYLIFTNFGSFTFWVCWFFPFFIAFALGSYLFYSQHNFPGAIFRENQDWAYDHAAISSTSLMKMNEFMHWMTGDIGFHHVHHLNSRIPFYRLREAMKAMPELQHVTETSWHPKDILACFRLKLWCSDSQRLVTMEEAVNWYSKHIILDK